MEIVVGIILLACIVGYVIYGSICLKHAARFRYLSTRTVYLSLGFVTLSTVTIMLLIGAYLWYLTS